MTIELNTAAIRDTAHEIFMDCGKSILSQTERFLALWQETAPGLPMEYAILREFLLAGRGAEMVRAAKQGNAEKQRWYLQSLEVMRQRGIDEGSARPLLDALCAAFEWQNFALPTAAAPTGEPRRACPQCNTAAIVLSGTSWALTTDGRGVLSGSLAAANLAYAENRAGQLATLLAEIRRLGEERLGLTVTGAVVSCPLLFTRLQMAELMQAGAGCGMQIKRVYYTVCTMLQDVPEQPQTVLLCHMDGERAELAAAENSDGLTEILGYRTAEYLRNLPGALTDLRAEVGAIGKAYLAGDDRYIQQAAAAVVSALSVPVERLPQVAATADSARCLWFYHYARTRDIIVLDALPWDLRLVELTEDGRVNNLGRMFAAGTTIPARNSITVTRTLNRSSRFRFALSENGYVLPQTVCEQPGTAWNRSGSIQLECLAQMYAGQNEIHLTVTQKD